MKKFITLVLAILTLTAICVPAMAAVTKYVTATPNVNFRETPGGDLIDRIPYGASVSEHSTSTVNGVKWSYVTYNGDDGYVQTQYLSTTRPTSSSHPTTQSQAFGSYTLKKGQTSYYVKNLQIALNHLGFNAGSEDGIFGSGTLTAVNNYQKAKGLTADGLVGSGTKSALWSDASSYLKMYGVMAL